jgi:hypothetical protein
MMRFALLLLACAACGDEERGELPTPDDSWPGAVTWSWSFTDGTTCPPDVTTANLYRASYDREMNIALRSAPLVMASVPCARGSGSFLLGNPLGIGRAGHDTWLELATADGRIYARSDTTNTRTKLSDFATIIDVERGWLHAAWTLRGATSNRVLTCDEVLPLSAATSADGAIELYVSVDNDVVLQPSLVDCARGELSLALAPGTYDLTLGAFSGFDFIIGEIMNPKLLGKAALDAVTVTAGATTELGTHELVLVGF